jgi:hypothetical protein
VDSRVSEAFVSLLVDQVTEGFGGDVGIVPRQFLREFVGRMDLVDEYDEYDPMAAAGFVAQDADLTPEEKIAAGLGGANRDDGDDGLVPATDVW